MKKHVELKFVGICSCVDVSDMFDVLDMCLFHLSVCDFGRFAICSGYMFRYAQFSDWELADVLDVLLSVVAD